MLRTLFHIPSELAGVPVFGVGWLLAVWGVVGVVVLVRAARRDGLGGEFWSYVPLLAVVAAAIVWLLPAVCDPEGLPIRGFGTMMLVAVAAGTAMLVWRSRPLGLEMDVVLSWVFWMFVPGIVGARLFYVIEYWPEFQEATFGQTLAAVVNVAQGGLVVYGALLAGLGGMVVFARVHRLSLLPMCDALAPCLVLGLAIGRIGCLLNGCCYGGPCERPWAIRFPYESPPYESQIQRGQVYGMTLPGDPQQPPLVLGVQPGTAAERSGLRPEDQLDWINGYPVRSAGEVHAVLLEAFATRSALEIHTSDGRAVRVPAAPVAACSLPVSPTQPLGSINGAVLCLFLLAYEPLCRRQGELFALLLTLYPITRFLLEIIRTDENPVFNTGLSISQNVSILLLLAIAGLWVYILRQPPRRVTLASRQCCPEHGQDARATQ